MAGDVVVVVVVVVPTSFFSASRGWKGLLAAHAGR
jgi:hypothetical protein